MNGLLHWNGPAVKKLLGWRRTDDEEKWAEKAVEALVKKLKKRTGGSGTLDDLEYALANPGSLSKCVTIPKSLDGRLQVSHKKGLPHVIYCRVWRWPDLQSHQELKHIPECMYPHDNSNKTQHICINPYHYVRVEHARPFSSFSASSSSPFSSPQPIPSPESFSPIPQPMSCSGSSNGSEYGIPSPSSILSEDGDNQPREIPSPEARRLQEINETSSWISIMYYELNTRVGQIFKMTQRIVTVDGFTDPSNSEDRICLGLLSNVNRNGTIENTRRHIGRGVRLEYDERNNLTIVNLSEAAVFVQSRNCNLALNQMPTAVCRVPSRSAVLVFDNNVFYQMLERARLSGTVDQLYDLQRMCFIRLSFVKGWGPDYPRQDVTSTPCWIELQLLTPLTWIDQVLPTVSPTQVDGTSVS